LVPTPRRSIPLAAISTYNNYKRGRDKAWSLLIGRAFLSFGSGSVLSLPIRLAGVEGISIGNGVFVGPNSWLQTIPEPESTARLTIGHNTSIAGAVVISVVDRVTLGRSVLLAKNVYISDHIHAYNQKGVPVKDQGVDRVAPVHIGDGAWLGQGVVVVPGVTIGSGSVVGANSVVTSSIPERSLAVGVPARVVRVLDE
jgi:acetyltransferase-like isoleucine patch superfamily enzyme